MSGALFVFGQVLGYTVYHAPLKAKADVQSKSSVANVAMASSSSDSNINENLAVGTVVSVDDGAAASEKEIYWEVERVIREKTIRGGQTHYLIKWKGSDQTTWEPKDNLCDSALEEAERLAAQKELRINRKRKKKKEDKHIYHEVERVRKKKLENGKEYFLIKWKGSDEETWEPEENLCDSAFEKAKRLWNEVDGSVVCVDSENGYCTDDSEEEHVYWEIEGIKNRRMAKGVEQFLIKWKGSNKETWEPSDSLCDSAIEEAREKFGLKGAPTDQEEYTLKATNQVLTNFQKLPNLPDGLVEWENEAKQDARVNFVYSFASQETVTQKIKWPPRKRPAVLELFAGIGGMSLGFLQTDHFETKWVVEANPLACAHQKILGVPNVYQEKVEDFLDKCDGVSDNDHRIGYPSSKEVDHVHASPPCQGFSRANRFGGVADAENKKLSYTFVRALKLFKPTTATFENVEGIFQTKHVRFLQNLVTQLIRLDYQVRVTVLDASNYGDAQKRRRVILFASLKGWPIPPCPELTNGDGSNALALYRTVRDTIGDLESVPPSDGNGMVCLGEDRIVCNHQSTEALSSNLDASDRIKPDLPVSTILTTSRLVHYSENRLLTVRETARLFGFPDSYQFFGRMGEQYQQLGNAVPVGLATAVAKSISTVYGKT